MAHYYTRPAARGRVAFRGRTGFSRPRPIVVKTVDQFEELIVDPRFAPRPDSAPRRGPAVAGAALAPLALVLILCFAGLAW